MRTAVDVRIVVDTPNEETAWEFVDKLIGERFAERWPEGVKSWAVFGSSLAEAEEEDENALFPYAKLAAAGITQVNITYNGHNDEGWINEIEATPLAPGVSLDPDLHSEIEQCAYDVLSHHYGGWEINEGSDGTIELDVAARKAKIEHGWVVESHRFENKEV